MQILEERIEKLKVGYKDRQIVFNQFRRKRMKLNFVELDFGTKIAYKIADWLDAIETGWKIHQAKKGWWERIGNRILRALEAVLLIGGAVAAGKLKK